VANPRCCPRGEPWAGLRRGILLTGKAANVSYRLLLLEWQDGWKEVTEIDPTCKGVSREDGFPELVEIVRRPLMLKSISVLDTGVETVQPKLEKSVREGKKIDHFHKLNKDSDARAEQVDALKKAATAEGIDLKQLKAGSRQQDVCDFIAYLAKHAG